MKAFSHSLRSVLFGSLAALAASQAVTARAADVSLYAIYKTQKFVQGDAGSPTQAGVGNPFRFGARVTPETTNSVLSATVSVPGGAVESLTNNPDGSFEAQEKFKSQSALETMFAPGTYTVNLNTLHDGTKKLKLSMPIAIYPNAPHISNFALAQAIDAGASFTLKWDALVGGTTNDYINFIMGDANTGQILFSTPDPFKPGALNGTATSVVMPANILSPGQGYAAELTFYKVVHLVTTDYPGAVGAVAFACFTDFNLTTATSPLLLTFSFRHFANGGDFVGTSTNPTAAFPVTINSYRVNFTVRSDSSYPPAGEVFFTGPATSGLVNTPADVQASVVSSNIGSYFSPRVSNPPRAPAGAWTVNYKGALHPFDPPDPQASSRLVIPFPSVSIVGDILLSVSWSYKDPNGNALNPTPLFLTSIRVQAQDASDAIIYDSLQLAPGTRSHSLTTPVSWSNVARIRMLYGDDLGNVYLVSFNKTAAATMIDLTPVSYLANGAFQLALTAQVNHSYLVQSSADLINWSDVLTTNIATPTISFIDGQAASYKYRFYRAKSVN